MTGILHFGVLWDNAGVKPCQSGTVLTELLTVIRRGRKDLGKNFAGGEIPAVLAESLSK
jgi:hypothetical protein